MRKKRKLQRGQKNFPANAAKKKNIGKKKSLQTYRNTNAKFRTLSIAAFVYIFPIFLRALKTPKKSIFPKKKGTIALVIVSVKNYTQRYRSYFFSHTHSHKKMSQKREKNCAQKLHVNRNSFTLFFFCGSYSAKRRKKKRNTHANAFTSRAKISRALKIKDWQEMKVKKLYGIQSMHNVQALKMQS